MMKAVLCYIRPVQMLTLMRAAASAAGLSIRAMEITTGIANTCLRPQLIITANQGNSWGTG